MKFHKKLLLVFVMVLSSCIKLDHVNPSTVIHSLEAKNEFNQLWNISDIDVVVDMIGITNKIIIDGQEKINFPSGKLFGIDSLTGKIIWTAPNLSGGEITSDGKNLYTGLVGIASVRSYDINNGELLWHTILPLAHSVINLYCADQKIFAYTNDEAFFILNQDGKIESSLSVTDVPILEKDGILFISENYLLKGIDKQSQVELWSVDIGKRYTKPILNQDTLFIYNPSTIYSIEQETGSINWTISEKALSNLYVLGEKIYFLNVEGYLIVIDKKDGTNILKIGFSPAIDLSKKIGDFIVTGDSNNNVLVISFGDTNQIMGLQINNP